MKAIRLFGKTTISWKSKTEEDALKQLNEEKRRSLFHEVQRPTYTIKETNRKRYPYDVSFSFYSIEELKNIAEYYIKEIQK